MKKLYNQIEQNLKVGLQVVVQDLEDNNYCTFSNSKDSDGNYRCSCWYDTIEKAKQYIGSYSGYDKDYWDEKDLEIIEVYSPEFEPFKIGDKVRILDSIKKTEDWQLIEDEFEDMKGVIRKVFIKRTGTHYNVNGLCIGHEFLAPLEQEVEELTMEEVCKLLGKDIKIKK